MAPPDSIGPYLELSIAARLLVPAGRWNEVEAALTAMGEQAEFAAGRLVWLELVGGLALRRGDLRSAEPFVEELRRLALASGEAQRIVPMAGIALPWSVLAERPHELRSLTEQVVGVLDAAWPSVLTAVPIARALAAAGETELLREMSESMRRTPRDAVKAKLETSLAAADGLLALLQERASDAVRLLTKATERERVLGYTYETACLEVDLARALGAAGEKTAAAEVRTRSASILEPLGCVNPF